MKGISVLAVPLCEKQYEELSDYWHIVVTQDGEIYNTQTKKYLKKTIDKYGYERVSIGGKSYLVHRLVAMIYIKRLDKSFNIVCHKNKKRTDNRVTNLMWTNNNFINIRRNNFECPNKGRKVVALKNGKFVGVYSNGGQASRTLKVNRSEVYRCCKGLRKSTGGYEFCYLLDFLLYRVY